MVHDKVHGTSNKSPSRSSSRRSSRYRPMATVNPASKDDTPNNLNQELWTTINTLNLPQQTQLGNQISNHTTQGSSVFLYGICESDGTSREDHTSVRSRSEKSILDKVEDMDIDHHSDCEENSFSLELPETSTGAGLQMDFPDSKGKVAETKNEDKEIKEVLKGVNWKILFLMHVPM